MTLRLTIAALALASAGWVLTRGRADALAVEPAPAVILMEPEITWAPDAPGEGTLFVIRVTESLHTPVIGVHGRAGPEELHFAQVDERSYQSLAAIPVGTTGTVDVSVRVVYEGGGEETLTAAVPYTPGTYHHEQLTVAPRFGSPPSPEDQARLARDQEKARGVARAAHRTPRIWTGEVLAPRDSRVTSGFGDGREFNGQISSRHMGLDLQGFRGDTVYAAARGVVQLVDSFLLAGNIVYLNHGGGLLSGYFHLSEQLVAVGDTVEPGDPIGRVGATGRVTGPHLHWVVRYGQTSVDPRSLLTLGGS